MGKREIYLQAYREMERIRALEIRGEAAYQAGHVGGFFHSYIGQEAIQTAAVMAIGKESWWTTSYRCHALALLLGVSMGEIYAELFGRENGNAKGRGGSMHLFSETMLGGFGIVGGQIPIGAGAAFSLKYQGISDRIAVCFLGDGAVPQGAFHETLNLASLWSLPCLFVIENNEWGMGTSAEKANATKNLADSYAKAYGIEGREVDGMDFAALFSLFSTAKEKITATSRPWLIEAKCHRFRGHSISDPALYRSKESLKTCQGRDPLLLIKKQILEEKIASSDALKAIEKEAIAEAKSALEFAEKSPWPDLASLEKGVFSEELQYGRM